MPSGVNLLGIFGVLISILVTAGFLAFHAIWLAQSQCLPSYIGCPLLTPDQLAYQQMLYGLELIFLAAFDLALGLSLALAFLASTRSDISEATKRSLFLFATLFLFIWLLLGSWFLSALISIVRYGY